MRGVYDLMTTKATSGNQTTIAAAGTAYSLTATPAALDFGTTDPAITLTKPGTYLLLARAQLKYNGATFAANRTVTLKLRRTNNGAGDLGGLGTITATTGIVTTITESFLDLTWHTTYQTVNSNDDAITIFGDVSVVPSAGSLDVVEASILALRIQQP